MCSATSSRAAIAQATSIASNGDIATSEEPLEAGSQAVSLPLPDAERLLSITFAADTTIEVPNRISLTIGGAELGGQPLDVGTWQPTTWRGSAGAVTQNEDGTVGVIFNGQIYNHVELRRELVRLGHVFRSSHADTEVLVHGYEAWGQELAERLNGMFAFAIVDRRARRLYLARDRFGEKPLYWSRVPGGIAFASELSALDGALLDVNLNGAAVFPVADALAARGVPFVFSTGYDSLDLPERFRAAPCLEKPHDPFQLERRLVAAFRRD